MWHRNEDGGVRHASKVCKGVPQSTGTALLGHTYLLSYLEPDYLINGIVSYFFWPKTDAVKQLLRHYKYCPPFYSYFTKSRRW